MDTDTSGAASQSPRLPPHSREAEAGVLSCCFQWAQDCAHLVLERLEPDAFYDLRNQELFDCVKTLSGRNGGIDLITLTNELNARGKLDSVGGLVRLNRLMDVCSSQHQLEPYLEIVMDLWSRRRMLSTAVDLIDGLYGDLRTPAHMLASQAENMLADCSGVPHPPEYTGSDLVSDYLELCDRGEAPVQWSTGFVSMDAYFRFRPGEMIVVGARPSVGKTAFAVSMISHLIRREQTPSIGFMSLEMRRDAITHRILSQLSQIPFRVVRDPSTHESCMAYDLQRLTAAAAELRAKQFVLQDQSGATLDRIFSVARRWKRRFGLQVLFIDYLQLIKLARGQDRYTGVTAISNGIKELAKELDIAIVALCQLNREAADPGERPRVHHARDTGSIEQDADVIMLLQRHHKSDGQDGMFVHIDKVRNDPTGTIELQFRGPTMELYEEIDMGPGSGDEP